MPYQGKENEMIVMNSYTDLNRLFLCFFLENDEKRWAKKSLNLLMSLFNHKGQGGLYQCLKGLNYVSSCYSTISHEPRTAFRMFMLEIDLTESGMKNYKKVLALTFEYFKIVKDKWLIKKNIDLFNECK